MLARLLMVFTLLAMTSAWAQERSEPAPSPSRPNNTSPLIDPSENVKALSEAANKRQDDLRIAAKELFDAKIAALKEINILRSTYDRELLKVATDRLDSEASLRSEFNATIAATEKQRVDAIRLVDTGAVAIANERATATANTLAKTVTDTAQALSSQVTRNAEDLRLLVKTTADEQTRSLQQQFAGVQNQLTGISTRVTALEQLGAEGAGRQKFQDPAIAALVSEVRSLRDSRATTVGAGEGRSDLIGWLIAGIMLLISLGTFVVLMRRSNGRTAAA